MNQDEWDKQFDEDFDCSDGLPDGYSDWDNYYTALKHFMHQRDAAIRQEALEEVEKVAEGMKIGELKPHEVEERTWVMCNTQVPDAYDLALTDLTHAITKLKGE
jgi:predicted N-acyltransferase